MVEDLGAIEERRPAINEPRVEALMRLDAAGAAGAAAGATGATGAAAAAAAG